MLMRRDKSIPRNARATKARPPSRQQVSGVRELAAIGRYRQRRSPSMTAAAEAEGTTVKSIRKRYPKALIQDRPGARIRVKATDPYSARVEIVTDVGPLQVTARGSRQRELAGRHRATFMRVLRGKAPASDLEQFHDKTVGGQKLISDYDQLIAHARAGSFDQLDTLYVSPGTSA